MPTTDPTAVDTDGGDEADETGASSHQEKALHELRTARIARLEEKLEQKTDEIEQLKETIEELREQTTVPDDVEEAITRGSETANGTPNRDRKIASRIDEEPPDPEVFEQLDDDEATLHQLIVEGPSALTVAHNPVYPVHERARNVLLHAPTLGNVTERNGRSHIRITLPEAKLFIESQEDQSIKHTQMRRVFEKLVEAGSEYPRPPIMHKNKAGHIELALFDYDALFSTR